VQGVRRSEARPVARVVKTNAAARARRCSVDRLLQLGRRLRGRVVPSSGAAVFAAASASTLAFFAGLDGQREDRHRAPTAGEKRRVAASRLTPDMVDATCSAIGPVSSTNVSRQTDRARRIVPRSRREVQKNERPAPCIACGRATHRSTRKDIPMKYGLAWLLGIPIPILAVVYLLYHC